MLKDITLGQYYPIDSIIHRLDPRTKLSATMLYIVSLFIAKNVYCYLLAFAGILVFIKVSKVPFGYITKGLKPIIMLLMLSVSFNLFLTQGEPVYWEWHFLHVTGNGIRQAAFMGVRLILLIMGSSMLTFTTTPNELTDGMEKGLGFLKVFHISVHEIAMMMSIALRFIPILTEETDKIQKAQMARGADFENGNIIVRAKALIPLLVPLFISAFRRAMDLAMAMEARCYHGGEGRTKMFPLKYHSRDRIAYLILFAYVGAMIAVRILL